MALCDTREGMKMACHTGNLDQVRDILRREFTINVESGALAACKGNQPEVLSMLCPRLHVSHIKYLSKRIGFAPRIYTILDLYILGSPTLSTFVQTYQQHPHATVLQDMFPECKRYIQAFLPMENKWFPNAYEEPESSGYGDIDAYELRKYEYKQFVRACKRRDHKAIHTLAPRILQHSVTINEGEDDDDTPTGISNIFFTEDPELVRQYIPKISWHSIVFASFSKSIPFVQSILRRPPNFSLSKRETFHEFRKTCRRLLALNDPEIWKLFSDYIPQNYIEVVFNAAICANRLDIVIRICQDNRDNMIDSDGDDVPYKKSRKRKRPNSKLTEIYIDWLNGLSPETCRDSYPILEYLQTEFTIPLHTQRRWQCIGGHDLANILESKTEIDVDFINKDLISDTAMVNRVDNVAILLNALDKELANKMGIKIILRALIQSWSSVVRCLIPFILLSTKPFITPYHIKDYCHYPEMIHLVFPFLTTSVPDSLESDVRPFFMKLVPNGPSVYMTRKQVYHRCILTHGIDFETVQDNAARQWVRSLYMEIIIQHLIPALASMVLDCLDPYVVSAVTSGGLTKDTEFIKGN